MRHTILFAVLSLLLVAPLSAEVSIHKNEESGLLTWSVEDNGFSIELIQLLPDFVRAIYASHGFPKAEVEDIASYCVFGTIIKNTTEQALHYDVSEWRYVNNNGTAHQIKTKPMWIKQWQKAGIVFSWTLLPDKQTFAAGDWQQGFTTIKHPRNESFDLHYKWAVGDTQYQGVIANMHCAPEELPNE